MASKRTVVFGVRFPSAARAGRARARLAQLTAVECLRQDRRVLNFEALERLLGLDPVATTQATAAVG